MAERTIELEQRGAVARVWMNRPAVHNALDEEVIGGTDRGVSRASAEGPTVRVIVLSGRGRSFCAGADIDCDEARRVGHQPRKISQSARELAALFAAIALSPKPTIARVNGAALGAASDWSAACDIAIAARRGDVCGVGSAARPDPRRPSRPMWCAPSVRAGRAALPDRRNASTPRRRSGSASCMKLVEAGTARCTGAMRCLSELLAGAPLAHKAAKELIDAVAAQPITRRLHRGDRGPHCHHPLSGGGTRRPHRIPRKAQTRMGTAAAMIRMFDTHPDRQSRRNRLPDHRYLPPAWASARWPCTPTPMRTAGTCAWRTKPSASAPAPARESYLNIERILAAARQTGAQAIHPGYGFLSENAEFAEACAAAGIVFIGPAAACDSRHGIEGRCERTDAQSRRAADTGLRWARSIGPIVPARSRPDAIGYPVMIKANAGGGGKGMRRVEARADFARRAGSLQARGCPLPLATIPC